MDLIKRKIPEDIFQWQLFGLNGLLFIRRYIVTKKKADSCTGCGNCEESNNWLVQKGYGKNPILK